jgi:hypothetical protein
MQPETLPLSDIPDHLLAFVDWLSGTVKSSDLITIKDALENWGFATVQNATFRPRHHKRAYQTSDGLVTLLYKHKENPLNSNLEFTATALRFLENQLGTLQPLFEWLVEIGFIARRIDLSCDDYSHSLPIHQIKHFYDRGWVNGFNNTGRLIECGQDGSAGLSMRFGHRGSKGSGKSIIFYDKNIESKGKINAIRVELSLADNRADVAFTDLCMRELSQWPDMICGLHADSIDFVDDNGDRPDWWLNYLTERWHPLAKIDITSPSFERLMIWWDRQILPSLVTFRRCFGEDFQSWIDNSSKEYQCSVNTRNRHKQIIAEYKTLNGTNEIGSCS